VTVNTTQRRRAGVYPAFSFDIQAFGLCLAFGFCHLNFVWTLAFGIRALSVIRLPVLLRPFAGVAKTNGKPTKRIVRILATESARGTRFTYGKDLLNSAKDSHFDKTNHPGFAATVCQPSRLVKTNGRPTKRIVLPWQLNNTIRWEVTMLIKMNKAEWLPFSLIPSLRGSGV